MHLRDEMRKEEIIALHALCHDVKEKIKHLYRLDDACFSEYVALDILPHDVHKSKAEHEKACYVLGKEIAVFFSRDDDYSGFGKTARILEKLATRMS